MLLNSFEFNRSYMTTKKSKRRNVKWVKEAMGNHAKRHLIFNASSKRCTTLNSALLPFWIMYGTNCEQFPRGVMNTNFWNENTCFYSFFEEFSQSFKQSNEKISCWKIYIFQIHTHFSFFLFRQVDILSTLAVAFSVFVVRFR